MDETSRRASHITNLATSSTEMRNSASSPLSQAEGLLLRLAELLGRQAALEYVRGTLQPEIDPD